MTTRRHLIESTTRDLAASFVYYDRKEDEDLPRGHIEAAILAGEITVDEICEIFRKSLQEGLAI